MAATKKKPAPRRTTTARGTVAAKPARQRPARRARTTTLKTHATDASVQAFLDRAARPAWRRDCDTLVAMMRELTGEAPRMWGPSIVGFGQYHYVYASGHQGDMCVIGFSPRKTDLTVYLSPGFDAWTDLRARLGPHKVGKVCLYLKGLEGIDLAVLRTMMRQSIAFVHRTYGAG